MLYLCRDHLIAAAAQFARRREQSHVVALGAARGEDDVARGRQQIFDLPARIVKQVPRLKSERVKRRRIAEVLFGSLIHELRHFIILSCCSTVIQIYHVFSIRSLNNCLAGSTALASLRLYAAVLSSAFAVDTARQSLSAGCRRASRLDNFESSFIKLYHF